MKLDNSLLLYAVTDRSWLGNDTLENQVESALKGGTTFIQLREKNMNDEDFLNEAIKIKKITDKYNVPFLINDNIIVAIKSGADGIHVGQSDMAANDIRKLIGKDKILGVSAQTVEQAILAQENGADYIGVGAVFNTSTKLDADSVSFDTLKTICQSVTIPVIAIGGINEDNMEKLKGSGICGVAVVSAIFAQKDITKAAQRLFNLAKESFSSKNERL